jgi:hypothetical protein
LPALFSSSQQLCPPAGMSGVVRPFNIAIPCILARFVEKAIQVRSGGVHLLGEPRALVPPPRWCRCPVHNFILSYPVPCPLQLASVGFFLFAFTNFSATPNRQIVIYVCRLWLCVFGRLCGSPMGVFLFTMSPAPHLAPSPSRCRALTTTGSALAGIATKAMHRSSVTLCCLVLPLVMCRHSC